MNSVAVKFFCRHGSKSWRPATNGIRMSSSDDKCLSNKPEPSLSSATAKICPQSPPCPSMPLGPSATCPEKSSSTPPQGTCSPDPNNPCNYVPPTCKDPNYPDMTKIKRLQCKFQQDDGLPVFLKKGTTDVILYHTTVILTGISFLMALHSVVMMASKN